MFFVLFHFGLLRFDKKMLGLGFFCTLIPHTFVDIQTANVGTIWNRKTGFFIKVLKKCEMSKNIFAVTFFNEVL